MSDDDQHGKRQPLVPSGLGGEKSHSAIAVSKLAITDLQDPHSAFITSLSQASSALEKFISISIEEVWSTGAADVAVEWLKAVIDLSDVVEAASATSKPRGGAAGLSPSGLAGREWGAREWSARDMSAVCEAVLLEVSRAKRQTKAFKITLATFSDLGRARPESLTFQDWCDVRRDAFDLSCVLDTLKGSFDLDRK